MKAQKKKYFLAGIGAILILWCIIRMVLPEKSWSFSAKELELAGEGIWFEENVINENKPGWYIDNSMDYGEVFARTPKVDLPMGSYDITIHYQTQGNSALYSFESAQQDYRVMLGRTDERLEEGKADKRLEVNYWNQMSEFSVKVSYKGEGYLIINGIEIQQTRRMERMLIFSVLAVGICFAIYDRKKESKRFRAVAWGAVISAGISVIPLISPYLTDGFDLTFHLLRIEGLAEEFSQGQIPVRMQSIWMNGYGYPVSVFYGDLLLSIAGILRWIGFSLQGTYKIYVFFVGMLTFYIGWYSFDRIIKDWKIAIFGAFIYTIAPYRLMSIYGGRVGAYSALVFFPLVFAGAYEILVYEKKERKNSWLILAAGITGVLQNHILSTEIVGLILGITCLIFWKKTFERSRFLDFIKAAGSAVAVNLMFLIPFLDYMREDLKVTGKGYNGHIQTNGAFISQILSFVPSEGISLSVVDGLKNHENVYAVGIFFIAALLIYFWVRKGIEEEYLRKIGNYCSITGLLLLFMCTSWFPWDRIYDLNTVFAMLISRLQFPWRLMGAATLMLTVVICVVLKLWKIKRTKSEQYVLTAAFIGTSLLTAMIFLTGIAGEPQVYFPDAEAFSSFDIGWGEYVPQGTEPSAALMQEGKLWHNEMVEIHDAEKRGTTYTVSVSNLSQDVQTVELPMTYYKYYCAEDASTGGEILLGAGENGRIRLSLAGNYEGTVQVRFREPLLWCISECISLVGMIGIIWYIIRQKRGQIAVIFERRRQNG